jgi:integrase
LGEGTIHILQVHWDHQQLEHAFAGNRWQDYNLIFPSRVGTPNSPSNFLKEFRALLEKAGLPNVRFHDLRHSAASIMLNHGVPALVVSKILGHSKPSTTLDIYGHLIPIMQEGVAQTMDELFTPIQVDIGQSIAVEKDPPAPESK